MDKTRQKISNIHGQHCTPDTVNRQNPSKMDIANKLYSSILENRIPPGTKLGEQRLAVIFSVSRARIRYALNELVHARVVKMIPREGAYVAKPTAKEATECFDARRLIEPYTVRELAKGLTGNNAKRLRQQLVNEEDARNREDQPSIIRLSGEFHVLLAELAGNSFLLHSTRQLCSQTCLTISVYSEAAVHSCRADEHTVIADVILQGDGSQAAKLILQHLDRVQKSLKLNRHEEYVDLEELFLGAK